MCDTFTGILHGLIDSSLEVEQFNPSASLQLTRTVQNVFYFIEALMDAQDLKLDLEMAMQVMYLVTDIWSHVHNSSTIQSSQESHKLMEQVKNSGIQRKVDNQLGGYMTQIKSLDMMCWDRYYDMARKVNA